MVTPNRKKWRHEATWPERWFDQLAEKYHTPAALLERMLRPDDLTHEIAVLIARAVREEARELDRAPLRERVRRKRSKDWFDRLVVERWRLDRERKQDEDE